LKKFACNYLFKYIFFFLFFQIMPYFYKPFNIGLSNALRLVCTLILCDIFWYLYEKYKKKKHDSYSYVIRSKKYMNIKK